MYSILLWSEDDGLVWCQVVVGAATVCMCFVGAVVHVIQVNYVCLRSCLVAVHSYLFGSLLDLTAVRLGVTCGLMVGVIHYITVVADHGGHGGRVQIGLARHILR